MEALTQTSETKTREKASVEISSHHYLENSHLAESTEFCCKDGILEPKHNNSSGLLNRASITVPHGLTTPVTFPFELPTKVYGAMLVIWHLRPLLQKRFPLHRGKQEDFIRFLAWCAIEGRRQYRILREIPEWDKALSQPLVLPALKKDKWAGGYSVAMFFYGLSRYRYFLTPILKQRLARHRSARNYWRGERSKHNLPSIAPWQIKWLEQTSPNASDFVDKLKIRDRDKSKSNAYLVNEFGLDDVIDTTMRYKAVDENEAAELIDISLLKKTRTNVTTPLLSIRALKKIAKTRERFIPQPTQFALSNVTNRVAIAPPRGDFQRYPFGVNLFGYAQGEIGIGEDVRLVALALKSQNIPFCILNVKPGENVSQNDASVDHWLVDKPKYSINLFCTTGIEQVRYGCEHGLKVFQDRYNIGFWPWELPDWPASCNHAYSMVNEIWGISRYTAAAYKNSQRPVIPMGLPVTVDAIANLDRSYFDLPSKPYLFVFSFDFNSTLIRKNPQAVISAFLKAFPQTRSDEIGLVIKTSHVVNTNNQWKSLEALAQSDPRIHIINKTLRKPEVLALYKCCDCYVSLHRAEGFGRGLAEALLLNMQLIVTNFSGNLDFCHRERAGLVDYEMSPVEHDSYFHADGQIWADPNVLHAAQLMIDIIKRPKSIYKTRYDFTPEGTGKIYAQRLYRIKNEIQQP